MFGPIIMTLGFILLIRSLVEKRKAKASEKVKEINKMLAFSLVLIFTGVVMVTVAMKKSSTKDSKVSQSPYQIESKPYKFAHKKPRFISWLFILLGLLG